MFSCAGKSFLELNSFFFSEEEKEEPVHSLVANSHPSQKLQITQCDLVKFSETVPCVERGKSRGCSAWEHKSLQIKDFGYSCLIAAELSLTRCSPACCSSYRPSSPAKMPILFEIGLLSFCPHHPAVRTVPSGNRAARMGDDSSSPFLPWSLMQCWSFMNSEKGKYCAPPLLSATGQQFLKYFP